MKKLIEDGHVAWPCIRNADCILTPAGEWGVDTWPANFLIDQKGVVRLVNEFEEEKLALEIERLLNESQ